MFFLKLVRENKYLKLKMTINIDNRARYQCACVKFPYNRASWCYSLQAAQIFSPKLGLTMEMLVFPGGIFVSSI